MLTSDSPVAYRGVESYKHCMEACCKEGNSSGALLALSRMRAEGLEPDLVRDRDKQIERGRELCIANCVAHFLDRDRDNRSR